MLREYYAGSCSRPPLASKDYNSPDKITLDMHKKREIARDKISRSESVTENKFEEIKKKYGSRERNTASPYQSSALQEISMRHSNYSNLFKSRTKNVNSV